MWPWKPARSFLIVLLAAFRPHPQKDVVIAVFRQHYLYDP